MSTEPLLPSYSSATRGYGSQSGYVSQNESIAESNTPIPATPVIKSFTVLIFSSTAIISTIWAHRSYTVPDPTPLPSAPILPYFASLSLLICLATWIGYLIFVFHDPTGGPLLQRKIVIWTSAAGKLTLVGLHISVWRWYKAAFPDSVQPNWFLVLLAAQAWWDVSLFFVYACLGGLRLGLGSLKSGRAEVAGRSNRTERRRRREWGDL
ncbi:hypothetical protein BO71DRAFT_401231 [Aspergillus ellipticus CBS 707.79]|uniref:Uncharacterized protein n=1 Tax=Aspergillus ellipticus CBS 707.79 TaxID=1448320 RepID=A0A319D274_9EURO|nr:hypothetical protein BO71DRAFT_401231 [Aspergillus ellipticus CBS 707.79]